MDGNVTRDHYGVLVLQSPSGDIDSPMTADNTAVMEHARNDVIRENEEQLTYRGHAFKKQLNLWDSVKGRLMIRHERGSSARLIDRPPLALDL